MRPRITAAAAAAIALVAGCGTGGEPTSTAAGSPATPVAARAPLHCPPPSDAPTPVAVRGTANATPSSVIDADDFFFAPTCLVAPAGTTVEFTVRNTGRLLHNIAVPGHGIDIDLPPGHSTTVRLTVPQAPLTYVCKFHTTSGMVGLLVPRS